MILSFSPIILGDENINCAGRPPGKTEQEAVFRARAVILPQAVREDLYRLCRAICPLVWPNFDSRFAYPGKVGQIELFSAHHVSRPRTMIFPSVADFRAGEGLPLPFVLKSNTGHEGRGVFAVRTVAEQEMAIQRLKHREGTAPGFVQQEWIDHGGKSLRVVLIDGEARGFWFRASSEGCFFTNMARGGRIDFHSDKELVEKGIRAARNFAAGAGINLAAFDILFDRRAATPEPLFMDINYYFGRSAFGGSEEYYRILRKAAVGWLKRHSLQIGPARSLPRYSQKD